MQEKKNFELALSKFATSIYCERQVRIRVGYFFVIFYIKFRPSSELSFHMSVAKIRAKFKKLVWNDFCNLKVRLRAKTG